MREFETAVKAVADEDAEVREDGLPAGTIQWKIKEVDDEGEVTREQVCTAFKPNDGQLAMFLSSTGRHRDRADKIAGIIDFFVAVLDDESHYYIVDRLLDVNDPFGLEEVSEYIEMMTEEWSGKVTGSRSASVKSRPKRGPKSTATTPALT